MIRRQTTLRWFRNQTSQFKNEQGSPAVYHTGIEPLYCTYDESGNLFVDGRSGQNPALAELPSSTSDFVALSLDYSAGNPGQLQWDGKYLAYQDFIKFGKVSQLQIDGSSATVVGTTTFKGIDHSVAPSWIYDNRIIIPYNVHGQRANSIGVWRYPEGGKIVKSIREFGSYKKRQTTFHGVAISVQP